MRSTFTALSIVVAGSVALLLWKAREESERRTRRRTQQLELARWEGEGGAPPPQESRRGATRRRPA
ncbi:MAG: hypothetical protein AB7L76_02875 [Burkholderiaceae bacterium]